jgi:hypothetical protein
MKPLWQCPRCGRTFVSRNLPHSCHMVDLGEHFAQADPIVRETFVALVEAVEANGPLTINATRSRITFQTRMRFGGVDRPRNALLSANFVLTRAIADERLARVDHVPPYYYVHRLRLEAPEAVDPQVERWFAEAHLIGEQRHVTDKRWERQRVPPPWVHVP